MLDNICKGTYNLKIQRFLMCVEMVNIVLAIMMQDPLHVGKKLDNLLLSTIKWCYGVNTCKQKILLVFEKFNKD
jgi:hypothetical protein